MEEGGSFNSFNETLGIYEMRTAGNHGTHVVPISDVGFSLPFRSGGGRLSKNRAERDGLLRPELWRHYL